MRKLQNYGNFLIYIFLLNFFISPLKAVNYSDLGIVFHRSSVLHGSSPSEYTFEDVQRLIASNEVVYMVQENNINTFLITAKKNLSRSILHDDEGYVAQQTYHGLGKQSKNSLDDNIAVNCQYQKKSYLSEIVKPGELNNSFIKLVNYKFSNTESFNKGTKRDFLKLNTISIPFIENKGQYDEMVAYAAKTFTGTFFVTKYGEILYDIYGLKLKEEIENGENDLEGKIEREIVKGVIIRETLVDAKVSEIKGIEKTETKVSYFKGNNQDKWQSGVDTYNMVSFGEIYEGVELKLKAFGNNIEKLFYINSRGNVKDIRLKIEGAEGVDINEQGELVLKTEFGEVKFTKPVAYELETQKPIEVAYVKFSNNEYGFDVGEYDKSKTLVIDPLLASTFLGGGNDESIEDYDKGLAIGIDKNNNIFVAGWTKSIDFPTTVGSYKKTLEGISDVFIAKFDSNLTTLISSTFLGSKWGEHAYGIEIDYKGYVYVTGWTGDASTFPKTNSWGRLGYKDVFVSKFNSDLTALIASVLIGGEKDDEAYALDVYGGFVAVGGMTWSSNFPAFGYQEIMRGAFYDGFVVLLNSDLNRMWGATYIGGTMGNTEVKAIKMGWEGYAYIVVAGDTSSPNFPTSNSAYDRTYNGGWNDGFISKFEIYLNSLYFSTYLGGRNSDEIYAIEIDESNNIYVAGRTDSSDFPVTKLFGSSIYGGFVSKFNSNLTYLISSTVLYGGDVHYVKLDSSNTNLYIVGRAWLSSFPTTSNAYDRTFNGKEDAFISKLNNNLNELLVSTFLGGSSSDYALSLGIDQSGNIVVAGITNSSDFPVTISSYDRTYNGGWDIFISKLDANLSDDISLKLLQPNGGQKWKAGSKYVIKWESPLDSYKFTLSYSTDNKATWTNIATVLASNRCTSDGTKYTCTYVWTIPAQDGRKPQSFVRVKAFNSSNQTIGIDDSDKAFVIEVLRVTSPNGGETLKVGSIHTITWETYALTKTVAKVILQYSTNGGQSWTNIKTFVGSNPGQFNWTVPNTPSTNCKVRVILKDTTGAEIARDVSDRVFTIQQ